ncbi:MAG TPA: winged helix-turn-helix domain-containing protein [Blastocatellia bacterium]|nr:winged helix-turn-helix domain-containing protein [Blastocatellia bacterium]
MSKQEKHFYEFGPFRLDPVKRRLLHNGEPLPLAPKAFDTLLALVQQSGKTIEKDDLMKRVWPDAVVEENNLNQNITALRKSLGDSRQESKYIATIPGFGYRFVAEVKLAPLASPEPDCGSSLPSMAEKVLEDKKGESITVPESPGALNPPAGVWSGSIQTAMSPHPANVVVSSVQNDDTGTGVEPAAASSAVSGEPALASLRRHRKVAALVFGLIIISVTGVAILLYRVAGSARNGTSSSEIEVTPLTRTGTTGMAAISPDGRYIVYSVHEAGRESLWLRQLATSSAQQIIPAADVSYLGLTFSRDGNHLYMVRTEENGLVSTLRRMPALGGVPARLLDDIDSAITLAPDGSQMAFVRNSRDESALIIANADGGNQHKLARRPMTDYFKIPAWSRDGKVIACSSGSGDSYDLQQGIVAIRVEDGAQRAASPPKWAWTHWVEWLADGKGMLITAREHHGTADQIWHVSYPDGNARRLTSDSKMYRSLSLTADAKTMAAVQTELLSDIWVAPGADAARARKVTFGTGSYGDVCYAPDGRIVYSSQASGNLDIWIMNADGSGQKQLTADSGVNHQQTVSPDGRYIVFASNRAGVFNIWRMDSDGGNPVRLTRSSGEKFPYCSPDGKWVVYNTAPSDQDLYSVWKVSIDGGEPEQLPQSYAERPVISPDGSRIAYFQGDGSADDPYRIIVVPLTGGSPERTFVIPQDLAPLPVVHWAPDNRSLNYSAIRSGISNVWRQPLDGSAPIKVTDFKVDGRFLFDWSRDGKDLVLSRRAWPADLVLLSNFTSKSY